MTYIQSVKVKCTNKLCDYDGVFHVNENNKIYTEKCRCPKCGFKTLDLAIYALFNDSLSK